MAANWAGVINGTICVRLRCFSIGLRSVMNAGLESTGLAKGHSSAHRTALKS
jgi:hypothetical protein